MNSKDNVTNQKKQKNKKRRNPFRFFFFDFVKVTGALYASLWLRPKRLYESKKAKKHVRGGAIVIANHPSFIDPVAILFAFWYRRVHIMATQDMFRNKIGNWFFRRVLCIPVNKNDLSINTFRSAMEVLDDGGVLGIFPEGTVNDDASTLKSFKSGVVLLALKGHAPIVPVYLVPPKKWYNRVVMVIGNPINLEEMYEGTPNLRIIEEVSVKLRDKEFELMEIYEKWKTRKSSK